MPHPYFDLPTPLILGHRGAAGEAPENTLPSFARALEAGAHILESDVHVTRDGVPVLLHDPDVDRTTNGRGRVADLTLAELQRLDAAHAFPGADSTDFPFRNQGIEIPTLRQAFETFPAARWNLEIKADGLPLARSVVALVQELGREDRTLLTAGENSIMACVRAAISQAGARPAVGASLADVLEVVQSALDGRPPETDSMALQIPRDFAGGTLVTPRLVEHAHRHGLQVHVWTINERQEILDLLALGVDGIVTDWPGRMAALLAERAAGAA